MINNNAFYFYLFTSFRYEMFCLNHFAMKREQYRDRRRVGTFWREIGKNLDNSWNWVLVCYEYLLMDFGKIIWHIVNPWIDLAPNKGFTTFLGVWQLLWFVRNKEFDKKTHFQPLKLLWRVSTTCCGYESLPKWCLTYPSWVTRNI